MIALIGLGNPGEKHSLNRHNIGFIVIDELIDNNEIIKSEKKFNGDLTTFSIGRKKIVTFKSCDYMNECGGSIAKLINFYKLGLDSVYVFHDDLDISLGKVKIKNGGSPAGHNGLKSIDSCIGKNYNRVRVGIDHPGSRELVNRHVLGNFKKKELEIVDQLKISISSHLKLLISDNKSQFLNNIKL
jgi:PTH1 family peptidyl-tRNA hydrolase